MINQINDKLTDIKAAKDDNDTKKYNDLLTLFCNSFVLNYTFGTIKKPPQCTSDILSFMNDVIVMKPVWVKPVNIQKYIDTLQNQEVVAIISKVQAKIDEKNPFRLRGGGGSSFLQKTHHIHQTQIHQTQPQQPPPSPSHRQKIKSNQIKSNTIHYNISQMKYCIYATKRRRPHRRTSRK